MHTTSKKIAKHAVKMQAIVRSQSVKCHKQVPVNIVW